MSETNQDSFAHGDSFRPETLMTVLPVPPIVLTSQKIAFGSIGLSIHSSPAFTCKGEICQEMSDKLPAATSRDGVDSGCQAIDQNEDLPGTQHHKICGLGVVAASRGPFLLRKQHADSTRKYVRQVG
jgi:hypothetical protein